jgi:LPXTG-motif cell wall-anchored protein
MIRKILGIAALLVVVTTGAAQAQDYPPATNSISCNKSSAAPGEDITCTAQSYTGATSFDILSTPVRLGTVTANANGVAVINTKIPANTTPGQHSIQSTGTGRNGQQTLTLSTNITITGTGTAIPRTGSSDSLPMATIGVSAVAVGGLLLLLANRRRTVTTG